MVDSNITGKIGQALGAYGASSKLTNAALGGGDDSAGPSFGDMLMTGLRSVAESQKAAENVQAKAVVGKASVTDVVQAVSEAEIELQTFTAIRDRVIAAYQDIMRMPV